MQAHCNIIPPYLITRLLEHSEARVNTAARLTLDEDILLRNRKSARTVLRTVVAASPGPQRTVYDASGSTELPGRKVRGERDRPTSDVAVTEAYDGLGDTWTLYKRAFDRDSLDDAGLPLLATVHYGQDYDNAFWNDERMVFGDGDGTIFNRFTKSVDVIGHELTHGVTSYTANLVYEGQAGALNESMSDVFGSMVKQHTLGQSVDQADWLIGQGLFTDRVRGVALRSMRAPGTAYDDQTIGKDPQPDSMSGYVDTVDDNGGVHINSGIANRAFYLAATAIGGKSWEGAGLIWYDVLTAAEIKPDCDFGTFAALTIDAAQQRFGKGDAVAQAWRTVGADSSVRDTRSQRLAAAHAAGIRVIRSGGIAGISRECVVRPSELPGAELAAWDGLLKTGQFDQEAHSGTVHDAFSYRFVAPQLNLDAVASENDLPNALRSLIERSFREIT
ncbi:MAG: protealysin inhibitor emfourin [Antricoccus sp.]